MEEFQVKDKSLAPQGHLQIEWASKHMPVLNIIKTRFEKEKPLKGQTIGACLHVTKETAVLIKVLIAGGAKVALCGSNPLSTQDDVAAALADSWCACFRLERTKYRGLLQVHRQSPRLQTDHNHG